MKCDAKFFGSAGIPVIDLSKTSLVSLAEKSAGMGLTVPGVQKKLSLHLSDEDLARLTLIGLPAGYILKPQSDDFRELPEAEDLAMDIADAMGVRTSPHGLIELDGELAYITKRADRREGESYAMEDFCQLSGRLTEDKYKGSYERCAKIIKEYSLMPGFDLSEFFLRLAVCFATGNSDMHLKNFSLIEMHPGKRDFVLSPAYDLLPVNLVMPEDTEETALTLNGKKSKLSGDDFLALASNIGMNQKSAENILSNVVKHKADALNLISTSYISDDMKQTFTELVEERISRLS